MDHEQGVEGKLPVATDSLVLDERFPSLHGFLSESDSKLILHLPKPLPLTGQHLTHALEALFQLLVLRLRFVSQRSLDLLVFPEPGLFVFHESLEVLPFQCFDPEGLHGLVEVCHVVRKRSQGVEGIHFDPATVDHSDRVDGLCHRADMHRLEGSSAALCDVCLRLLFNEHLVCLSLESDAFSLATGQITDGLAMGDEGSQVHLT